MLLALSRGETAVSLGVAAAVALAAWLVLLGILAAATRPRRPDPGPAVMDLPGTEPPAVANFLANRWEVGREAVPATLLDLAARRVLAIDEVEPDHYVCRLVPGSPPALEPYERQVLDHVRSLASNGVVPCEALTTGPDEASKGWWKRFWGAVVADARARGLCRPRWSRPTIVGLGVAALAPAVLAALAIVVLPDQHSTARHDNPVGGFISLAALFWALAMALPFSLRAERDTPEGLQAAAGWLGLREYLLAQGDFAELPPAAVAIWDRYLAYGAALGVAAGAVRALPLGTESERTAWSAYGGRWHVVRIRYPRRIPPGWGKHPGAATALGLLTLAVAAFVAGTIGPALGDALSRLTDESGGSQTQHTIELVAIAVFSIMALGIALWLLRAVAMLACAVPDLFVRREVDGVAVRVHSHSLPYLAVDDGVRRRVRAWLVDPGLLGGVMVGSRVHVVVSPRLGHVFRLETKGESTTAAVAPPRSAASPGP